jgi:glycosyltransferase involved in cell wall biosynthesis
MGSIVKVAFLVPYPLRNAPSQRFRVELFLPALEEVGIRYKLQAFIDEKTWKILYKKGYFFSKTWGILKGFIKRAAFVFFTAPFCQYIFVHREASPVGPPFFEWWLAKVLRKKIIYDFDDAIWMANTVTPNPIVDWIRACWKIKYICRWSYKIAGGNDYLCSYARKYNHKVFLIPTSLDTCKKFSQLKQHSGNKPLTIGWTGSHTTMNYLNMIWPILQKLEAKYQFDFLVISNKKPDFFLKSLKFLKWNEQTEIADLLRIDIGIMPVFQDAFSQGKCGFKIIQYMSLGIPAVASPVGVNENIIEHNVNGFLCHNDDEWYEKLSLLLDSWSLRDELGLMGRKKIVETFSLKANEGKFLALFN